MKILSYSLAFFAVFAALAPDICVCGCPCGMLFSGKAPASPAAPAARCSCCPHCTPTSAASLRAPDQ